ncbi:MAG TPA: VWA domain-containing protein [Thermoanaerobaculia bacterium]|nr:VWA domain-containing protein [Thermoanaerobaculia bacterium]
MRGMRNRSLAVLALVGAGLGTVVLDARAARKGGKGDFEETTRVIAVEVPVNVVDKLGRPVRGLRAEDFELFDEGRRQTLTGFEVVDLASPEVHQAVTPSRPGGLPSAARRHFLLLFDISFSNPAAITRAREATRELVLSRLHPSDLVAVAVYSLETGPRLIVTFTPDRAQVAQALDSLGLSRASRLDPLRFILASSFDASSDTRVDSSDLGGRNTELDLLGGFQDTARDQLAIINKMLERNEKGYARSQVTAFARALGEMAQILGSIEGRKQVLLFSEGFDSRLLTGVPFDTEAEGDMRSVQIQRGDIALIDSDDSYGNTGVQTNLAEMVSQFRRADCVIQAVDIGGLRAEDRLTDTSATGQGMRSRLNSGHDGLFYVANETGGELFKNSTDLSEQLPQVLDRSAVTYLLTFQTGELPTTGRFRRLKVKLADSAPRDARVSFRQGYFEPRPFEDLHPLEKDLLASDAIATAALSDEIRMNLLVAPFKGGPGWAYVPVIIELDGETLLAGQKDGQLSIELYAYATDEKSEMRGFFTQQVSLDISRSRERLKGSGIKYYGHLEMRPGDYQVRVLARNARTGRTGVKAISMTVPQYEETPAFILPPFFPEQTARWVMVRERSTQSGSASTVYPFTINGEPYVPAALPQIELGNPTAFYLVGYNFGDGHLSLAGEVVDAAGTAVPGVEVRLVERTATGIAGYDKLLAEIEHPTLAAGTYTLKVELTNAAGERGKTSIPIEIQN